MMKSIAFPRMFTSSSTQLVSDREASAQNLRLLLCSERGDFADDPEFGVRLKRFIFEQNDYVLQDVLIDEIYTKIAIFMPQLRVSREDIRFVRQRATLYVNIQALNRLDFTTDMYSIALLTEDAGE